MRGCHACPGSGVGHLYWSGAFDLVLAGFGSELERFDRVLSASDTPALMEQVCRRRLSAAQLLPSTGYQSFAQGRCAEGSKKWDPLVVICGPTMPEADVGELLAMADDPRLGIAVVGVGGLLRPRTFSVFRGRVIPPPSSCSGR